jgi:PAS domain S-box-containing protein
MGAGLRAAFDTAVDGVVLLDARGRITAFNPACERLFGYREADILGQNLKALLSESRRETHDRRVKHDRRAGARRVFGTSREAEGRHRDGTVFPLEVAVGEVSQEAGTLYICILHDISERKRREAEREALIATLIASNEERGNFAQTASHDLQQPLRMISAFCALLEERYGDRLDNQGREYLGLVTVCARQMRELIDDLLEYGFLSLQGERDAWFESETSLKRARDNLHEEIVQSGALITAESLPRIFGNEIRFTRLLQNLLANGLKYVACGTIPKLHVTAARQDEFWRYEVEDNGIGIDPAYHESIFEPFKRLHSRDSYKGTGLGLAICKKIVEGFGGRIWVRSSLGAGATFCFTVKATTESDP